MIELKGREVSLFLKFSVYAFRVFDNVYDSQPLIFLRDALPVHNTISNFFRFRQQFCGTCRHRSSDDILVHARKLFARYVLPVDKAVRSWSIDTMYFYGRATQQVIVCLLYAREHVADRSLPTVVSYEFGYRIEKALHFLRSRVNSGDNSPQLPGTLGSCIPGLRSTVCFATHLIARFLKPTLQI